MVLTMAKKQNATKTHARVFYYFLTPLLHNIELFNQMLDDQLKRLCPSPKATR